MNLKDKNKDLDKFNVFLEKIPTKRYKERWFNLFNRGKKGKKKIDTWNAWEDDFSNSQQIIWKEKITELPKYMDNLAITSFVFYGLGINKIITEDYELCELIDVLQDNLEGVYIMDDDTTFLVSNHDGDIIIYR